MKFLRDILNKQKPLFEKGGKFEKFYYLFEAGETFMFVPNEVTQKKGSRRILLRKYVKYKSHKVFNTYTSVVTVAVNLKATCANGCSFCKWVGNNTVAGLKANFWLEGVLANCTNHL